LSTNRAVRSRTLDDPLSPETPATDGEGVAETIFFILLQEIAASTEMAGGIIEGLDVLTKFAVGLGPPDQGEWSLADIAQKMRRNPALVAI
jgi:hypothetical protein